LNILQVAEKLLASIILALTNTNTSGIVQHGSIGTFAAVTSHHVDTLAVGAGVDAQLSTFVDILADISGRVQLRSSRTDTLKFSAINNN
jgi:hypothetical protein